MKKRTSYVGRLLKKGGTDAEKAVAIFEKTARKHQGDRAAIAKALGISATTLWRYCRDYSINLDGAALDALDTE